MDEIFQLALVVVFAAVLLVTGLLFMEYQSKHLDDGGSAPLSASSAR